MELALIQIEQLPFLETLRARCLEPVEKYWASKSIDVSLYVDGMSGPEVRLADLDKGPILECSITAAYIEGCFSVNFRPTSLFECMPGIEVTNSSIWQLVASRAGMHCKTSLSVRIALTEEERAKVGAFVDACRASSYYANDRAIESYMNTREECMCTSWRVNRFVLLLCTDASTAVPYLEESQFARLRVMAGV